MAMCTKCGKAVADEAIEDHVCDPVDVPPPPVVE